jgi:hypothetical protein
MISDTTKNIIHKVCCGDNITVCEIIEALRNEYENGINEGIKIVNDHLTLMKESKKGS